MASLETRVAQLGLWKSLSGAWKDDMERQSQYLQCSGTVEDMPVGVQRQASTVQTVHKTVESSKEFGASDSIPWRQGKFLGWKMVLLDCSASFQQNHFMKDSKIMKTT